MTQVAFVINPAKCVDIATIKRIAEAEPTWATPHYLETTPDDAGRGATERALSAGAELIVVCGGDGTVAACVGALARTGVPLAIIPYGTGNLLARNLRIPRKAEHALDVAINGHDVSIDVGLLDGEPFAVMAGLGFDAAMLKDTDDDAKARVGWLAYVAGAVRHLRDQPNTIELRPAGGPAISRRSAGVLIGNVGHLQADLPLLPNAKMDDGLLDVLVMAPTGVAGWLRLALAVVLRRPHARTLERLQVAELDIVTDSLLACERDGEVVEPRRTAHITVDPRAILVRIPHSA